jgi:hypothetical protein
VFQEAINSYDEKGFIASLVCSETLDQALRDVGRQFKVNSRQLSQGIEVEPVVQKEITHIKKLARQELGFSEGD